MSNPLDIFSMQQPNTINAQEQPVNTSFSEFLGSLPLEGGDVPTPNQDQFSQNTQLYSSVQQNVPVGYVSGQVPPVQVQQNVPTGYEHGHVSPIRSAVDYRGNTSVANTGIKSQASSFKRTSLSKLNPFSGLTRLSLSVNESARISFLIFEENGDPVFATKSVVFINGVTYAVPSDTVAPEIYRLLDERGINITEYSASIIIRYNVFERDGKLAASESEPYSILAWRVGSDKIKQLQEIYHLNETLQLDLSVKCTTKEYDKWTINAIPTKEGRPSRLLNMFPEELQNEINKEALTLFNTQIQSVLGKVLSKEELAKVIINGGELSQDKADPIRNSVSNTRSVEPAHMDYKGLIA